MLKYIVKRVLMMIPVLLGITFLIFFVMSFAEGDPALAKAGNMATEEQLEELREEWGLNDPLIVRYGRYVLNMLKGDLGESYQYERPVLEMYLEKFPATFWLSVCALIVAVAVSLPLGIFASLNQNSWKDTACMLGALVGISMPSFWLALLLMLLFCVTFPILPSNGFEGPISLILPAITEGLYLTCLMTRTTRSSMLDNLRADYMTTALAKGVSRRTAIMKHAFRNALIPIVTNIGLAFLAVLGGTVTTERIFAWPGVGRAVIDAVGSRDFPVVTGFVIVMSVFSSVMMLLLDIVYAFIDPRIKAAYASKKK